MRKPKAQSELAIEMLCTFARYDTIVSHIGVLLHTAPAVVESLVATTSTQTLLVAAPAIVLYVNPMHPTLYATSLRSSLPRREGNRHGRR